MAYAALDSLVKTLDRIQDHQNSCCFSREQCRYCAYLLRKLQIRSLHENTVFLLNSLEGFPEETVDFKAQLADAAKQAERTIHRNFDPADEYDPIWKVVCQEIEKSIEETDSLVQEAMRIKNGMKTHSLELTVKLAPIAEETIEESLIDIKGRLLGEPSSHLEIIAIVGMSGIGKTTLARKTYKDLSTTHHFDVHAWVTVSHNSSAEMILSSLLSSIDPCNKRKYQHMDMGSLVLDGHKYLKHRRYLIVMDDMWDTNVWDDVRMAFPDDCNGSRIMITARELNVASHVDFSNNPHKMQLMSVDQSWRLLKEKVFGHQNCPPELEDIGKYIAMKCKGLPLAIVVIAGVLSKLNQMQSSWVKIARNVSEAVNTSDDEQFSDIYCVSYMHLPPHLRPCFLYMACFPEDYEIDVLRLIRMWLAEGFLTSNDSKDMEELGYEYLEDLAKRSLVLIEKRRDDGKIKTVKIHDIMRDLCIRKSRDENFLCVINEFKGIFPQSIENSHRLSMCSYAWGCIPNMNCTPIDTILFFMGHRVVDCWKHFRLLKVLDAMTLALPSFPVEISELIHLRYLALAFDTSDKLFCLEVPESLSKLQNLQTLVIRLLRNYVPLFVYMPIATWRMLQLRHIIVPNGFLILPDPSTNDYEEALPLGDLRTLWRIENFTCSERMLEMLPNLRKLGICYGRSDHEEIGWSMYGLNNLAHLLYLEKLSIHVKCNSYKSDLAQNLAFPLSLKRLTLSGCVIPWEEMTILGCLPNLEFLKLKGNSSQGSIWETTEGEFHQLKVLKIESTDLHQWITESSHFPQLERLTVRECNNLKEIPFDIGEIPTLQLIEVDGLNLPVMHSVRGIQEEQQSFGNDLKVSLLESQIWKRHIISINGLLPNPYTNDYQKASPLGSLRSVTSERILKIFRKLKKLEIHNLNCLPKEAGFPKYVLNNYLLDLTCLESLSIYANKYFSFYMSNMIQNLAVLWTLRRLVLSGRCLLWEDMSIIGSLPNLIVLQLKEKACYGTVWETIGGGFCQLKVLLIDSTDLQQWMTKSSHFPRLERLTLYECYSLKEIPYDIGEIPSLQQIEVDVRNLSIVQSAKIIQEEQQSFGNNLVVTLLESPRWKREPKRTWTSVHNSYKTTSTLLLE